MCSDECLLEIKEYIDRRLEEFAEELMGRCRGGRVNELAMKVNTLTRRVEELEEAVGELRLALKARDNEEKTSELLNNLSRDIEDLRRRVQASETIEKALNELRGNVDTLRSRVNEELRRLVEEAVNKERERYRRRLARALTIATLGGAALAVAALALHSVDAVLGLIIVVIVALMRR